ncbi:Chaperonin [Citrus sinensis]|nr:Chaperonin [Citrus sinensis]
MEFDEYEGIYLFPQILFFFYNYIYSFFLKFENDKIIGKKKSINKIEFVNGMKLDWGAVSSYLMNEVDRTCVLRNSFVLIHENKISDKNIVKQACLWTDYKRPLLIVAKDVELEVGGSLFLDKTYLQTAVIKVRDYEENLKAVYEENLKGIMQDLAILTGGRSIVRDNEMIIHGGSGIQARINKRCEQLGSAIKLSTLDYEIKLLEEWLRKLSRGANSLNAAKAAIEEGIVPGVGVVCFLIHLIKPIFRR